MQILATSKGWDTQASHYSQSQEKPGQIGAQLGRQRHSGKEGREGGSSLLAPPPRIGALWSQAPPAPSPGSCPVLTMDRQPSICFGTHFLDSLCVSMGWINPILD